MWDADSFSKVDTSSIWPTKVNLHLFQGWLFGLDHDGLDKIPSRSSKRQTVQPQYAQVFQVESWKLKRLAQVFQVNCWNLKDLLMSPWAHELRSFNRNLLVSFSFNSSLIRTDGTVPTMNLFKQKRTKVSCNILPSNGRNERKNERKDQRNQSFDFRPALWMFDEW